MVRPYALLRDGFPYHMTIGMRRITSSPVDIAFNSDGDNIYVLCRSGLGNNIRLTNFADDNLGTIGDGKFNLPACLLIDKENNLYVSDEGHSKVFGFKPDGELITEWGEKGSAEGQLDRPSGMAFDADENIYIADAMNHRVQKFTKDGKFLSSFGSHGKGDGEFDMPWGVAVDELGDVYVVDWRNDRVQKFTPEGEFLFKFGKSGNGKGEFNRPAGVTVDQDGDIYVADWGNNRVQQFGPDGRYVDQFIGEANLSISAKQYVLANPITLRLRDMADLEDTKRLRAPINVRVDDQGRLFIPDFGSHRIQVYKKEAYPLKKEEIAPPMRNPVLFTT